MTNIEVLECSGAELEIIEQKEGDIHISFPEDNVLNISGQTIYINNGKSIIDKYVEQDIKPNLSKFADQQMEAYSKTAQEAAEISVSSAESSNQSAQSASLSAKNAQESSASALKSLSEAKTSQQLASESATISSEQATIATTAAISTADYASQASASADKAISSSQLAENFAIQATESAKRAEELSLLIPSQSNNAGKFLSTDGSSTMWQEIELTEYAKLLEDNQFIGKNTIVGSDNLKRTTSLDHNTPPSSWNSNTVLDVYDKNNVQAGYFRHFTDQQGYNGIDFEAKRIINGNTHYSRIGAGIDANGNIMTTAPSCDRSGSILTTSSINKSSKGYVKLGNGILIQWGYVTDSLNGNTSRVLSFPVAFSNTNYSLTFNGVYGSRTDGGWGYIISRNTGSCNVLSAGYTTYWIAIGY